MKARLVQQISLNQLNYKMSAETEPLIEGVNTKFKFLRRRCRRQFECCVGALIVCDLVIFQ